MVELPQWLIDKEKAVEELLEQDKFLAKHHVLAGRIFTEVIGDDRAMYIITREYKNKVRLKLVPGCEYVVPMIGQESTVDKSYALRGVHSYG
jgi:hypothetical protein